MDWGQVSLIAGAVATVAALIGGFFKKVLPAIRKVSRFIDRVSGVPADEQTGQKEVVGLFARMDHQDAALADQDRKLAEQSVVLETIRHEVEFNNGSSVKDAVVRTENATSALTETLTEHLKTCPPQTTTINVNPGGTS